jgi:transcriptional regulator with XRE-family HTH domain
MPFDNRIRFGRAIRRVREQQEINQEEAAERCALHRTYYSGFERGGIGMEMQHYATGVGIARPC